jgi:transketolase
MEDLQILKNIRKEIIDLVHNSGEGHMPSAFSVLDIVYVLYKDFLKYDVKNPDSEDRDFFILSKGHGCQALYTVLSHFNFFEKEQLNTFCKQESIFGGHPDRTKVPGVEVSTGSLGHGLPIAVGIALSLKILNKPNKVVVLIGDGESEEGTVWESTRLAKNLKLDNLTVILDKNNSQGYSSEYDYKEIWKSLGWHSVEMDGHNLEEIRSTLKEIEDVKKPKIIIANTVKGKGVSFIENSNEWHHKSPNPEEYKKMMEELK